MKSIESFIKYETNAYMQMAAVVNWNIKLFGGVNYIDQKKLF